MSAIPFLKIQPEKQVILLQSLYRKEKGLTVPWRGLLIDLTNIKLQVKYQCEKCQKIHPLELMAVDWLEGIPTVMRCATVTGTESTFGNRRKKIYCVGKMRYLQQELKVVE